MHFSAESTLFSIIVATLPLAAILSSPAGCNCSAVSILDGAAHDRHLQADAASGRQGGVPLPGRRSPARQHLPVVGSRLSAGGTVDLSH